MTTQIRSVKSSQVKPESWKQVLVRITASEPFGMQIYTMLRVGGIKAERGTSRKRGAPEQDDELCVRMDPYGGAVMYSSLQVVRR